MPAVILTEPRFLILSQPIWVFPVQAVIAPHTHLRLSMSKNPVMEVRLLMTSFFRSYGTSVPDFVAANMGFSCTGGDCASHTFTVIDVEESSNGGAAANDEFLPILRNLGS